MSKGLRDKDNPRIKKQYFLPSTTVKFIEEYADRTHLYEFQVVIQAVELFKKQHEALTESAS